MVLYELFGFLGDFRTVLSYSIFSNPLVTGLYSVRGTLEELTLGYFWVRFFIHQVIPWVCFDFDFYVELYTFCKGIILLVAGSDAQSEMSSVIDIFAIKVCVKYLFHNKLVCSLNDNYKT